MMGATSSGSHCRRWSKRTILFRLLVVVTIHVIVVNYASGYLTDLRPPTSLGGGYFNLRPRLGTTRTEPLVPAPALPGFTEALVHAPALPSLVLHLESDKHCSEITIEFNLSLTRDTADDWWNGSFFYSGHKHKYAAWVAGACDPKYSTVDHLVHPIGVSGVTTRKKVMNALGPLEQEFSEFPHFEHNIRPFFLMSDSIWRPSEVTLATQLSLDRLNSVTKMAEVWKGPISVAVYISNITQIESARQWYKGGNAGRYVDVHLLMARTDLPPELDGYPINSLRQLAQSSIRTDNILMIDADFVPSIGLKAALELEMADSLFDPVTDLIVVPIFGYSLHSNLSNVLLTKDQLLAAENAGKVKPFGGSFANEEVQLSNSHRATNYSHWRKTTRGTYPIRYEDGYEPYFAGAVDMLPKYNELLVGPSKDKMAHLVACSAFGFKFVGLANGFLLHRPHDVTLPSWGVNHNQDSRCTYITNGWLYHTYVLPEIQINPMRKPSHRRTYARARWK